MSSENEVCCCGCGISAREWFEHVADEKCPFDYTAEIEWYCGDDCYNVSRNSRSGND